MPATTTFYHGLNISWGTGGTTSTAFGASALIQSIDAELRSDELEIKNQYGATVATVQYDTKTEATFDYVAADSTTPPVGTATVTKPAVGDMITVSGGQTSLNQTTWIVKNVTQKQLNTDALKVSVRATFYPLISV